MGKLINILDLAKKMVKFSGHEIRNRNKNNDGIEIKITGLRSGEKLYEELMIGDKSYKTNHPKIIKVEEDFIKWNELKLLFSQFKYKFDKSYINHTRSLLLKYVYFFFLYVRFLILKSM